MGSKILAGGFTDRESVRVRNDVDHLPAAQQHELERVKRILMDEFASATARATQPWKKNGRIQNIILFGSYARKDWVDDAANGYLSDFDILVIVSHKDLTDVAEYWFAAEDKIGRDPEIGRPVNLIVHTLEEVNQGLARGEYFWVDIARDGIALYELPGSVLSTPRPRTASEAYDMANDYLAEWLAKTDSALKLAEFAIRERENNDAAFLLHQAAERAYICFLLVRTHYVPRSHNLRFLRSLAEDKAPLLIESWPRVTKVDRRRFELLRRAYVEARYSSNYEIVPEELEAIAASVRNLRNSVEFTSRDWLGMLRQTGGTSSLPTDSRS